MRGERLDGTGRNVPAGPYVVTASHGVDKMLALLNLWATPIDTQALPELIDFGAVEYATYGQSTRERR